jgi:protein-tyrosine phosphatase
MPQKYTESKLYEINENYGGKRAWIQAYAYRWMDKIWLLPSGPKKYRFAKFKRLVFVCQGNICRSPYAEARARQLGISSASFGLGADDGKEANPSAARIAKQRGVILDGHSATHISKFSFEMGDLLLAFEPQQLAKMASFGVLPEYIAADLLGRWCSPVFPYLHDPYGLNEPYFNICFDRIDQALTRLAPLVPSSFTVLNETSHHFSR